MTGTLTAIASRLANRPVSEVTLASHGGNSRVYKVTADGKNFALKQYPASESDPRNRLATERRALQAMAKGGIKSVPFWIASEDNYALLSWIDGAIVTAPTGHDVDDAAIFLGTVHHLSKKTPARGMPLASEACLCGRNIAAQIEQRLAALAPFAKENPALEAFLSDKFMPTFTRRLGVAASYPTFASELPHGERTLIAADFGFHNIMKDDTGRLSFIDFEYFGWDDPVKLACDFLLHPATLLTEAMQQNFYGHMLAIYGEQISPRFAAYYPLFGLRWALILLNEFIPERWQARAAAKGLTDWEAAKAAQLAKAEKMLETSEHF